MGVELVCCGYSSRERKVLRKGIAMDSTARFLLGGALGAALGFLISQKSLEKVLKGTQSAGAPTVFGGGSGAAPASAPVTPESVFRAVAAPVIAAPVVPSRPAAVPDTPPEAPSRPAPPAPWVTPTPTAADTAAEAPVAGEPAWRISPAPSLAPAPAADRVAPPVAPVPPITPVRPVAPGPEWEPEPSYPEVSRQSEVIVTRRFLDEPVPGSGWGSEGTPAVSEEGIEDIVPSVSDVVLPYAGPEIESLATDARASRPKLVWLDPAGEAAIEDLSTVAEPLVDAPEDLVAEVAKDLIAEMPEALVVDLSTSEEVALNDEAGTDNLVAEISGPGTTEIEAIVKSTPFPRGGAGSPVDEELGGEGLVSQPAEPELVFLDDEGDAGSFEMEALADTAPVDPMAVELPVVDEPLELPVEELEIEELSSEEAPIEELEIEETLIVEAAPVVSDEPPAGIARVDDLKSRIEETRRRIRRELEQPFDTEEEVQADEPDWTVLPVVPVATVSADVTPVAGELEAPAVEAEVEVPEVEVIYPDEPEEPVDYESMKSRIEQTRSRLKAKAFDAMMTGESALLGRDAEGSDRNRNAPPPVDIEVDETIETSLREEEE